MRSEASSQHSLPLLWRARAAGWPLSTNLEAMPGPLWVTGHPSQRPGLLDSCISPMRPCCGHSGSEPSLFLQDMPNSSSRGRFSAAGPEVTGTFSLCSFTSSILLMALKEGRLFQVAQTVKNLSHVQESQV